MTDKIYSIAYTANMGAFTKDELIKNEWGGCDNIIIHSIILPEDGSYSHLLMSRNEKGTEMDSNAIWKAWVAMAHTLAGKEDLVAGKRDLCQQVFEAVAERIRNAK